MINSCAILKRDDYPLGFKEQDTYKKQIRHVFVLINTLK